MKTKISNLIYFGNNLLEKNNQEISINKLLLEYIFKKDYEYILKKIDNKVGLFKLIKYKYYLNKIIKKNYPIQYITNNQYFYNSNIYVNKNVLIPRFDTELLVEELINIVDKNKLSNIKILDLCTGSSAISVAVKKKLKDKVLITASDISKKVLKVAKKNIIKNKLDIKLIKSNLFEQINEKYDFIVSNPPYLNKGQYISNNVIYEPELALYSNNFGFETIEKIIINSLDYINKNGYLLIEHDPSQVELINNLCQKLNLTTINKKDYKNNYRYTIIGGY